MPLPHFDKGLSDEEMETMIQNALPVSDFLKVLSHEGRLLILCHLASGEKSVTELERLICLRQAVVSQQLARLRLEGVVKFRKDGKSIYYSLRGKKALRIIELVYDMFCAVNKEKYQ